MGPGKESAIPTSQELLSATFSYSTQRITPKSEAWYIECNYPQGPKLHTLQGITLTRRDSPIFGGNTNASHNYPVVFLGDQEETFSPEVGYSLIDFKGIDGGNAPVALKNVAKTIFTGTSSLLLLISQLEAGQLPEVRYFIESTNSTMAESAVNTLGFAYVKDGSDNRSVEQILQEEGKIGVGISREKLLTLKPVLSEKQQKAREKMQTGGM